MSLSPLVIGLVATLVVRLPWPVGRRSRCARSTDGKPALACLASTKDLVDNVLDRCGGVDDNAVLRDVFFGLMPSHDELAFRRHSAAPLVVRALVKPPLQRRQVDFEDKYRVEQVDELREVA